MGLKMEVFFILYVSITTIAGLLDDDLEGTFVVEMPGVHPYQDDAYLCTTVKVPKGEHYVVNFEPLANANTAHHMLLYGCNEPARQEKTWLCGSTCKGESSILYAWAKNANPTSVPKDVAFQIGDGTGIKHLVLQVHYKDGMTFSDPPDHTGTKLTMKKQRQKYLAGMYLLVKNALEIPPQATNFHGDVACRYQGETTLHPFAFRVHAHSLATVITGYQNNGSFNLLGKGNPNWPQAFYPIHDQTVAIKPGDFVAARCTYTSNRDTVTKLGPKHTDEMCNFYFMYYTDAETGKNMFVCSGEESPAIANAIPADASVPLPPNALLEDKAAGVSRAMKEELSWPTILPEDHLELGQVAGVATDSKNNVHIFHRGKRVWNEGSFDPYNKLITDEPIHENTLITFSPEGKVIKQWGAKMFYMPHGISIDKDDNIWLTDVGSHQVFKFKPGSTKPDLTLGSKLEPGSDNKHFCKPTDVAILSNGQFFVSDGYCNNRILKFEKDGSFLLAWGEQTTNVVDVNGLPPPGAFDIPHSMALLEDSKLLCVADRENGRIQCFDYNGKFVKQIHSEKFCGLVYGIAYNSINGELYAINDNMKDRNCDVTGFIIDPDTKNILSTWQPVKGFSMPHDITTTLHGDAVYVTEIHPNKVWKFSVQNTGVHQSVKKAGVVASHGHPDTVDLGEYRDSDGEKKINSAAEATDFSASIVIGALLVIPVIVILIITGILRLRKKGKLSFFKQNMNRRFNLGNFLNRHKGFDRVSTEESDHELDPLNSDSDVEEYSATAGNA